MLWFCIIAFENRILKIQETHQNRTKLHLKGSFNKKKVRKTFCRRHFIRLQLERRKQIYWISFCSQIAKKWLLQLNRFIFQFASYFGKTTFWRFLVNVIHHMNICWTNTWTINCPLIVTTTVVVWARDALDHRHYRQRWRSIMWFSELQQQQQQHFCCVLFCQLNTQRSIAVTAIKHCYITTWHSYCLASSIGEMLFIPAANSILMRLMAFVWSHQGNFIHLYVKYIQRFWELTHRF